MYIDQSISPDIVADCHFLMKHFSIGHVAQKISYILYMMKWLSSIYQSRSQKIIKDTPQKHNPDLQHYMSDAIQLLLMMLLLLLMMMLLRLLLLLLTSQKFEMMRQHLIYYMILLSNGYAGYWRGLQLPVVHSFIRTNKYGWYL